jgi:hypothetical protein
MLIKRYPNFSSACSVIRIFENTLIAMHAASCRIANSSLVLALQPINEIGKELDELWTRVKPDAGFSLIRYSAYWIHRYLDHPLAKYSTFSIRRRDVLVGLATIRLASITLGKPVLSLVEWMLEDNIPFDFLLS